MDQTSVQVVVGYCMSFVLEYLKQTPWFPVLTANSLRWVKITWAWLVAAGSALSITFSFDPTLGNLLITGLTWANVKGGLTAFVVSLAAQTYTYRVIIQKPTK